MSQFKFFVHPRFAEDCSGGRMDGTQIHDWIKSKAGAMSDASAFRTDFAGLSERLWVEGKKDFLIWDDVLKAAEMTFFSDQMPFAGPLIDVCCGYGFWTGRIVGKIDVGVDLFPDEGAYPRTIEGFVEKDFIESSYRSVLKADVTEEMPLPDRFFRSIVSVCALEHTERPENALATIARILRPDGKVYLSLQTNRYTEKFREIFHPTYLERMPNAPALPRERTWKEWEEMIQQAALRIESRRFILSEEETALNALMYWKHPSSPAWRPLGLEEAVKEIPEFRRYYFDRVRYWSRQEADPDKASIVCFICSAAD